MSDVIKDLVQTLEDGRKGFADAADKLADDGRANLAETFRGYSRQRAEFAQQLRAAAAEARSDFDEDGSIAGALHRGWISLKDALTGDDVDAIINAAITGEEHAVDEFEDALADDDLPTTLSSTVSRQAENIRQVRDRLRQLSAA